MLWDELQRAWAMNVSEGFDRFSVFLHVNDQSALVDMGDLFKRSTSTVDDGLWTDRTGSVRLKHWIGLCKNFKDQFCRVLLVLKPAPMEGELLLVARTLRLDGTGEKQK